MLSFLMPPKIATNCAKKFYELLEEELNDLFFTGIAGGKFKGALLMSRADQKGKEFDLGLRSCTSYDGACSVCEIMALPGVGPFTKTNVGEYRKYLPTDHPYRRDPTFGPEQLQDAPLYRTTARSNVGVEIVQDDEIELTHYQGYVHHPLFHGVRYYHPFQQSAADLSHNLSNFFTNLLGLLHPTDAMIVKWRKEACFSGRFVEINTETQQTLDAGVASELRGLQVGDYMTVANLRELARLVRAKSGGNKPELITRLQAVIQEINDTGTAVTSVGKGPIPWVLTDGQVLMFNNRCRRLVIPPYVHAFCTTKQGLFDDKSSCWRMISKMQVFMMLPVLLLGMVPALHRSLIQITLTLTLTLTLNPNPNRSLIKIVQGIILLNGRVISERVRRAKGSVNPKP